jgi:putative transposase
VIARFRLSISNFLNATKQRLRHLVKPDNYALAANVLADLTRPREELILENAFLRQQLIILSRQVKRPLARPRERVLLVALASRLRNWKQALLIVQPTTLIRWHQDLFRWLWARISKPPKRHRGQGPHAVERRHAVGDCAGRRRGAGAAALAGAVLRAGHLCSRRRHGQRQRIPALRPAPVALMRGKDTKDVHNKVV